MASIDLPRALEDYFAFAEVAPTRNGRRFSITMPYVRPDGVLDRLQWWYHLSEAKEKALGEAAPETLRKEAIARFENHIARWLQNTAQVLYGDGAIPQVSPEGARGSHIYGGYTPPLIPAVAAEEDPTEQPAPSDEITTEISAELPQDQQTGKTAFG
jgi:hypothetical protein